MLELHFHAGGGFIVLFSTSISHRSLILRSACLPRSCWAESSAWNARFASVQLACGRTCLFVRVRRCLSILPSATMNCTAAPPVRCKWWRMWCRASVNSIDRQPIDITMVEATYSITLITSLANRELARASLEDICEAGELPLQDIEIEAFGSGEVQIEALLLPTSVDGDELDALMKRLRSLPHVRQAFWSASTTE